MKKENFERLKTIISEKIKFNQDNVSTKLTEIPLLYCSYLDIFVKETKELANLKLKKDETYADLYRNLKYHSAERWDSKNEIENQMFLNPKYKMIVSEINDQQEVVTYLEQTLDNIKNLSYQIRNYIDWQKFINAER